MLGLFTPPKKVLYIHVVDYKGSYRLEMNYNGVFFTSLNQVLLDDDAPSRIPKFAGKTAGEAYHYRKEFRNPNSSGIPIKERERITTIALVEKAIGNFMDELSREGKDVDVVKRKDVSLVEWRRILRRPREIRYR